MGSWAFQTSNALAMNHRRAGEGHQGMVIGVRGLGHVLLQTDVLRNLNKIGLALPLQPAVCAGHDDAV